MVFGLLFYWRLSVFQYCWLESWQSWLFCQLRNSAPSKTQTRQNTLITTFTTLFCRSRGPDTKEGSWKGRRITDEPVSECQDISIENWHKSRTSSSLRSEDVSIFCFYISLIPRRLMSFKWREDFHKEVYLWLTLQKRLMTLSKEKLMKENNDSFMIYDLISPMSIL